MAGETIKLNSVESNKHNFPEDGIPKGDDDSYDPHLHRNVPHPTTNTDTLIHMLKGSLGTGILAMPLAFKQAGLANGFVFTFLIGALCTYCLHILLKSQYILCKRLKVPILSYPESMKLALQSGPGFLRIFAGVSPIIVDVFLVLYQLGICCVYIVFVAKNVKSVLDEYWQPKQSVEIYMLILLVPFILINLVRNLKLLAPFSTFANIVTFASFGVVLYYIFESLPSIEDRQSVGTLYDFPMFFGTTLFALEAVGVIIALENNMKTPKDFTTRFGVLNVAMGIVTVLYVGMGFLGYWRYGAETKDTITLNFPPEDVLAKIVQILYSIAIFISFGLQGYVPVEIMWNRYILNHIKDSDHLLIWEYLLRVAAVIITFIPAIFIPLLGYFISLFGAFCLSALGIIFPATMEICVKWPHELGRAKWILFKNILLIIIGTLGLLAGSYSSISEIARELSKPQPA